MVFLYIFLVLLSILLLICAFLVIALLHTRQNNPVMKDFEGVIFAHRGLHDAQKPENSSAAFAAAVAQGFGIEMDLHITRDGELVVHHDSTTKRMCGTSIKLNDSTLEEIRALRLPDGSKIPTFEEFVEIVDGKVPLLIELKSDGNNAASLVPVFLEKLRSYNGKYIVESFDPRMLIELKKRAPEIARGQLCENFLRTQNAPGYMRPILASMVLNLRAKPDFVAYNVAHRKALPLRLLIAAKRRLCFWTVRDIEEFRRCVRQGHNPIFEKLDPETVKTVRDEALKG